MNALYDGGGSVTVGDADSDGVGAEAKVTDVASVQVLHRAVISIDERGSQSAALTACPSDNSVTNPLKTFGVLNLSSAIQRDKRGPSERSCMMSVHGSEADQSTLDIGRNRDGIRERRRNVSSKSCQW